jgi:hypothetical protein
MPQRIVSSAHKCTSRISLAMEFASAHHTSGMMGVADTHPIMRLEGYIQQESSSVMQATIASTLWENRPNNTAVESISNK